MKKIRIIVLTGQLLFLMFVGLCLTVFTFFVPPFQKPDEPLHFKRAFALAMGQVVCKKDANHKRGYFSFPKNVDKFPEAMMAQSIIMKTDGKFPMALYRGNYPIGWDAQVDLLYNCGLNFTGYIPQSLGILLSMPVNSVMISFYLARAFGALFFLISLIFCLRMIPSRYRFILLFCSVLPMVLQQVTAVSYDCVAISLGFILFTLFAGFLEKKNIRLRDILVFYGILLLFIFSKPGYYLFSLLLFYPLQRLPLPLVKKILLSVVLFGGVIGIALYSLMLPI